MLEDDKQPPLKDDDSSKNLADAIEDTLDSVDEMFYGDDYQHDIPATRKLDSGRRVVNKVQTRKNFNKRFFGKKIYWIPLAFLIIGSIIFLIYFILEHFLMA